MTPRQRLHAKRLIAAIALWEDRVLNAPSIEVGRAHHRKLDRYRKDLEALYADSQPAEADHD